MAVSKVTLKEGNEKKILIDLTEDTVVEDKVLKGYTFHKANGEIAVGTGSGTSKLPSVIDGSIEVLNEEDFGDITEIREQAFLGCSNLKEVHIPETVKKVGFEAFWTTNHLNGAEVYYNGTFERVSNTFGSFRTSEANDMNYYKLNDNLYAILDKINFSDEETDISINENCEYISFLDLSPSTTSINIPQNVKTINGIRGSGLTNLVIPDSVQYLTECHIECENLASITFGSGLAYIPEYLFANNTPLTSITYTGTVEQFNNIKPTSWGFSQEIDVVCSDGTVKINEQKQFTIKLINTGTKTVNFTPTLTGAFNNHSATAMTQDGNTYTATVTAPSPLTFVINNNGDFIKFIRSDSGDFSTTTDCTITANFDDFPEGEYVQLVGTLTEGV